MQETEVLEVPAVKKGRKPNEQKEQVFFDEESNFSSKSYEQIPKKPTEIIKQLSRVFLLADGKKQGNYTIICVEDVIDPATGLPRRARRLRGATSIWMDEQKQFDAIKGYVEKNVLSFVFQKGRLEIQPHDKLANDFANVSNRNLDNPNRQGVMKEYFREWISEREDAKLMERDDMEFKAMGIAATAKYEEMIPHAAYLGVDFIDAISGQERKEAGIRTLYMKKAKADPKKFLDSIHSPVVQMSYKIKRAVQGGKIDLGRQPNQAFWADGGFICVIPQGRPAVEYLTEFGQLLNEASAQFVFQLDNVT